MSKQYRKKLKLHLRAQNGNILLLTLACLGFIIVPLVIFVSQSGSYIIDRERAKSAVEAAALLAANNLSRVMVDDPEFGFVSLSNYPPNGEGTLAGDGEPLPVTGINTLMGTVRQLSILGFELQNKTISKLAKEDKDSLDSTVDDLNGALSLAVTKDLKETLIDNRGVKIEIEKDVTDFLKKNLPPSLTLKSVQIENGWLSAPSRSTIELPDMNTAAHTEKDAIVDKEYRAFVDAPFNDQSYTFAGLGKSSALVNGLEFHPADAKHINSIVRLKVLFGRNSEFKQVLPFCLEAPDQIEMNAAAQPFAMADFGPAGVMMVRFSGGSVAGLHTWSDFLQKDNFHDRMVLPYQAHFGDYPADPRSVMKPSQVDQAEGTSQQFAEHLYYWLRNGHLRAKLSSITNMLNQRFQSGPNDIYAYEFNNSGNIARRIVAKDPFPAGLTSESQVSTMVDTTTDSGINPIIIFRNNVKRQGKVSGGKHAGQPIAGTPLNWCELSEYGGDDFIAGAVRKGRLATGLTLLDPTSANSSFRGFDGKTICLQPRKSFYSGGLAVDIEIGGTKLPKQEVDAEAISAIKKGRGGFSR